MNPFDLASPVPSSFRDPDSQVFDLDGNIYRKINHSGYDDYKLLMSSGLYDQLQSSGYIVPHSEVSNEFGVDSLSAAIIKPEKIAFISYPYEWCFSQLKDAALLTLEVTKLALGYNMILKDATAYNIQFHKGKPVLIDTGSFEQYQEGSAWVAYHQFCKHFLSPLALMAKKDVRLGLLSRQFIDGLPLDLTSTLLPKSTKFSLSLYIHIHAHAKFQNKYSDSNKKITPRKISKIGLLGLLDNLTTLINKLKLPVIKTEWGDYYQQTNYSDVAIQHKAEMVHQSVKKVDAQLIWDLGSNNGYFSQIASSNGASVISFDIDPIAVEKNYLKIKQDNCANILPLLQDLNNPSSAIGWAQAERYGLKERSKADLVMALALIHHLAISNNVPLNQIAEYFSSLAKYLLIEFVPKEDIQVKRLLNGRQDIFSQYHLEGFKLAFSSYYEILEETPIHETQRILFLMKRKQNVLYQN
jgi:hypothetical protein